MNNIPEDAEIIYISYCWEICKIFKTLYNNFFELATAPKCRHCYIISRIGANKIIEKTLPMKKPGDNMISHMINTNQLKGYIVDSNYLYIGQDRENLKSNLKNFDSAKKCWKYKLF